MSEAGETPARNKADAAITRPVEETDVSKRMQCPDHGKVVQGSHPAHWYKHCHCCVGVCSECSLEFAELMQELAHDEKQFQMGKSDVPAAFWKLYGEPASPKEWAEGVALQQLQKANSETKTNVEE